MNVTVLGGSGMLGAMVVDYLARQKGLKVAATARTDDQIARLRARAGSVEWRRFDAEAPDVDRIQPALGDSSWVINAIGVIKPYIHDDNAVEVERATRVNALFPHLLAKAAAKTGARVLQIATDCVYSGAKGGYVESDKQDALDVYGKTKSIGEVYAPNVHHLRVSIIGPEPRAHVSLLDWFLGQKNGATLNGFTNHSWNGVTTLQFARLCHGAITRNVGLAHLQHVVPGDTVTKYELLKIFAAAYKRADLVINAAQASVAIDRTLRTSSEALNRTLWEAAGYSQPPTVAEMVAETAAFKFSFAGL